MVSHGVDELRERVQHGAPPGDAPEARKHLVVWRDRSCFLRVIAIDDGAFELLRILKEGAPLGASCEQVAKSLGQNEADLGPRIAQWFQQWTAKGWLRAIDFPAG